ncbi:hypothetical protein N7468_006102 [Penicillium chermesinum]|uniref:Alpha-glucosidase n=1 Tax=Penicillium chermesinum TaxID=63820 RepID=A0A9W9P0D7_9EURO|nr:uncharacterized protein N7468_006102 [Penicillium chermesinum]KAJ5233146.1 hypothetical protein N7468_006102 [Penicillium chermesinum]
MLVLNVLSWSSLACLSFASQSWWDLGNGFRITVNKGANHLLVTDQNNTTIWETPPNQPFLSASAGRDRIVDSSGNFKITEVNKSKCTSQQIQHVRPQPWSSSASSHAIVIQGQLSGCGSSTAIFSLGFYVPADLPDRVAFYTDLNPGLSARSLNNLFLTYRSSSSEQIYGLGAQASFASLKNQSVPIFSREQGVGRGDQPTTHLESEESFFSGGDRFTTYSAVPQYITSKSRVFHLSERSTAYANFDFRDPEAVTVRYAALRVDGYFMQASDMLNGISMLTAYTGKMPELPRWVDTGVWLQDWCGTHSQSASYLNGLNISRLWWNWEADSDLYPSWNEFVQGLLDQHNVRTLSYINPFLANVSSKPDGYRRDLYSEATNGGYMIHNSTTNSTSIISSGPGIEAGIVDLTNPAACAWFQRVMIEQVWSANVSGYMCDFGEYTPVLPDTRLANTSIDPMLYHNEYPRDWAHLHHSLIDRVPAVADAVLFHRSSSMSANRHMNLYWAGDQNTNWGVNDGIKSAVTVLGHMGLSGYAHGHVEIGGYTTTWDSHGIVNRSAELLGRWGELAAVSSSVFRSHEGNVPGVNAQFYTNTSTYAYHAYNARMFRSLATYRRRILDTESKRKGWPLVRMPVVYYPEDKKAQQISYQSFFLGADLYVAPVLDPGQQSVAAYFPGEDQLYTHVWSGKEYRGGHTALIPAPYGKPAVFLVGTPKHHDLEEFLEFVRVENGTAIRV